MATILSILSYGFGIATFVLFIMVLIKQFQEGGVGSGIVGIITCGIWTLIWGWLKHKELGITQTMAWWSILIAVGTILNRIVPLLR